MDNTQLQAENELAAFENTSYAIDGKKYLDSINLAIMPQTVLHVISETEEAKRALVGLLIGHLSPTDGSVFISRNCQIGYAGQEPTFYEFLSGYENLWHRAYLKGMIRCPVTALAKKFGLAETIKKKVKRYSRAERKKLAIARALIGNPNILVLDEPFMGMSAEDVSLIKKALVGIVASGRSILIASDDYSDSQGLLSKQYYLQNGILQDVVDGIASLESRFETLDYSKIYPLGEESIMETIDQVVNQIAEASELIQNSESDRFAQGESRFRMDTLSLNRPGLFFEEDEKNEEKGVEDIKYGLLPDFDGEDNDDFDLEITLEDEHISPLGEHALPLLSEAAAPVLEEYASKQDEPKLVAEETAIPRREIAKPFPDKTDAQITEETLARMETVPKNEPAIVSEQQNGPILGSASAPPSTPPPPSVADALASEYYQTVQSIVLKAQIAQPNVYCVSVLMGDDTSYSEIWDSAKATRWEFSGCEYNGKALLFPSNVNVLRFVEVLKKANSLFKNAKIDSYSAEEQAAFELRSSLD
ncbi:MAG: ATP-binding cassette domain-containing protein [Eubacteriaceae bacterium]|nr:ATP-binding cassette domain-containing protein [Eubacteriaceae bacterium]